MKPRQSSHTDPQTDLFKVELAAIIDLDHALVRLVGQIDRAFWEHELGTYFCENNGSSAKPERLMVGLDYLKQTYNLSDEQTVLRWVENLYWQHFCGMKWFEHTLPNDPSSMTCWLKLLGEQGAESLLAQSIATGLKTQTIKPSSLHKLNVDTTVQAEAVAFPTDARLYYKMRERLVTLAEKSGLVLRQELPARRPQSSDYDGALRAESVADTKRTFSAATITMIGDCMSDTGRQPLVFLMD